MTDESADALRGAVSDGEAVRLSDEIVDAWLASGDVPADGPWPDAPRFRLTLPATEESAALDVLAAILDASSRRPDSVVVHVDAGRRDDRERVRSALSDLAAHPDVTVADHETIGSVPLTGDTFDALADLSPSLRHLLVLDPDGHLVLARTDDRFTFTLPASAAETVRSTLSDELVDRLEPADGRLD